MDIVINDIHRIDVINEVIDKVSVGIKGGIITQISDKPLQGNIIIDGTNKYLTPAFFDAHFHVESTNLTPVNFAEAVIPNGTSAIVADCHEICNVAGMKGFHYFRQACHQARMKIFLTAPSCVPASHFGTNGATLGVPEIKEMLSYDDVVALGEMMNFPGVINRDPEVMAKIKITHDMGKIVNGHATGLRGEDLRKYISAGIYDDHESLTLPEMKEKLSLGMKIFLREGSAETVPDDCYSLLKTEKNYVMFCADDKLVTDILKQGHINFNIRKAVKLGIDPVRAVRAGSYNTAQHYNMQDRGCIEVNKIADVLILPDLVTFEPEMVILNGAVAYHKNKPSLPVQIYPVPDSIMHSIQTKPIKAIPTIPQKYYGHVIEVEDGTVYTKNLKQDVKEEISIKQDIHKLVIVERYGKTSNISACHVHGFGLKKGALGSTVAHDCHNIIVVGTNDEDILTAVNQLIGHQGGLCAINGADITFDELHVGGLMSTKDPVDTAENHDLVRNKAAEFGCKLHSPMSTLSFLALEVIPVLKLSDQGLFDVTNFAFV